MISSKYKTIWENHLKLLVADLRSGKAAEEYSEPKAAGNGDKGRGQ